MRMRRMRSSRSAESVDEPSVRGVDSVSRAFADTGGSLRGGMREADDVLANASRWACAMLTMRSWARAALRRTSLRSAVMGVEDGRCTDGATMLVDPAAR